jgi:hypothetical protein
MRLTPERLNNPQRVIKSANQQYLSDTTLNDDNDLAVVLAANSTYQLEFCVFHQSPAAADIKFAWSGFPAGAAGFFQYEAPGVSTPTASLWTATINVATTGSPTIDLFQGDGGIVTGASGGALRLQHAQQVSTATNTIVYAGSWLRATLV